MWPVGSTVFTSHFWGRVDKRNNPWYDFAMKVDSILTVKIPELSVPEWEKLERSLTYANEAGDLVISYRRLITKGVYTLPRGAWYLLPDSISYTDDRTRPAMPKLKFALTLDAIEKDARFAGQSR